MKNIFIKNLNIFILIFTSVLISGCKKGILESPELKANTKMSASMNALLAGSPVPPLDWENISFMPTPPNSSSIPVPWQGGLGGAKIDDDIIFDYHAINGWELVYNTFSTSATYNPSYFMLYNKYRGLLRVYFYISPGGSYPSSNIAHFLNLRGTNSANSPILDFASQEIVDMQTHSLTVGQLQPYKVSTTGSWYAAEFEIAYDINNAATPYDQLRLEWQINPNSITNITLNGLQTGDISGTVTSTSGGPNFFSSIANNLIDGGLKIGDSSATKLLHFLPTIVKGAVVSASKNALGGIVKGFLSGILGGTSSTSTQKVNLKINTKISITGTATTESQLFENIFSIPGTQNVNNTVPFYPQYQSPLGVFYLSSKPIVIRTINAYRNSRDEDYRVTQRHEINQSSFQLIFNPAVTSIADILNIKKEVVLLNLDPDIAGLTNLNATLEQVGDKNVYTGNAPSISKLAPRPIPEQATPAVRITFDVVPKDGSPKCTIVKTFLANQTVVTNTTN